jgi:hypothetical protein
VGGGPCAHRTNQCSTFFILLVLWLLFFMLSYLSDQISSTLTLGLRGQGFGLMGAVSCRVVQVLKVNNYQMQDGGISAWDETTGDWTRYFHFLRV